MKLDPGMHIVMHLVFFGKTGVTMSLFKVASVIMMCMVGENIDQQYTRTMGWEDENENTLKIDLRWSLRVTGAILFTQSY
jgi:hypothetical protein